MGTKPRTSRAADARPKKTAPKRKGVLGTIADFAGDMTDNALPNWGDEIAGFGGGLGSLIQGRPYMEGYKNQSGRFLRDQKAYDKNHPALAWGSTIGGTVVGAALPAGKVAKGATLGQKVKTGAKVGAAYGALSGAGKGHGVKERATNAAKDAPIGALVGAGGTVVVDKAVKAAPKVARVIKDIIADETGQLAPDKTLKAAHWSLDPKLTETDPSRWTSNRAPGFLPREEVARKGTAPDRTYFGLLSGEGVTQPYKQEGGLGPYGYEADLPVDKYFDADGDKSWITDIIDGLPEQGEKYVYGDKPYDSASLTEQLIKDAGYSGYRTNNHMLGDVAVAFEPVPVSRVEKPIEGAPASSDPFDPLRNSARGFVADQGREYTPPTKYVEADPERAQGVAQAYDQMAHDPGDPEVREAYEALARETEGQYRKLADDGFSFSFDDPNSPAYTSPWEANADLRTNRSLKVYPTDAGYGSAGITDEMVAENPLLKVVDGITWDGKPVRVNDLFRGVHDAYGHAKENFGFRATGEENAFRQHLPMYSEPAQRALATETRGQNSFLNFGPDGEFNRSANQADTIYADQKIGLMPDEFALGGTEDFMPDPRGTLYGYRGDAGGRGAARIWNDEGLDKVLADRGVAQRMAEAERRAPTILKEQLPRQPDYGYPVTSSKLRNQPSYDELGVDFEQTLPMADRAVMSPEDMQGGTLIAGMADLTRAGGVLKGVRDQKFWNPVSMQGGQDFMRTHAAADTGSIWASDKGPMVAAMRRAREAEGPAYYTPYTMNAGASDYSHHMTNAVVESMASAPKALRGEFDEAFRKRYPEFKGTYGILSDQQRTALADQLASNPGMRTSMVKELDKARWRDAGMPNIGVLRQAVNDPNLAKAPTESFGYSVGQIDPTQDVVEGGIMPHDTYRSQLPGKYLGGFESQVPVNIMFPDWFDNAMSRDSIDRDKIGYMLRRGVPTQEANQKWLDGIMPYLEWARSTGDLDW